AIGYSGLNYKAGEGDRIGKFGLGLKSVFHLCEAFFYLSSNRFDDQLSRGLITPWRGVPGRTDGWAEGERAALEAIEGHIRALAVGPAGRPWFCLWLPLRLHDHHGGHDPIIGNHYPGEHLDDVFPAGLAWDLAEALPLLRKVCLVQGWQDWRGTVQGS